VPRVGPSCGVIAVHGDEPISWPRAGLDDVPAQPHEGHGCFSTVASCAGAGMFLGNRRLHEVRGQRERHASRVRPVHMDPPGAPRAIRDLLLVPDRSGQPVGLRGEQRPGRALALIGAAPLRARTRGPRRGLLRSASFPMIPTLRERPRTAPPTDRP
jgi:hypothetical protein